jgi:hypothetical protein
VNGWVDELKTAVGAPMTGSSSVTIPARAD